MKEKIQTSETENKTKFEKLKESIKSFVNQISTHTEEIELLKKEKWIDDEYKWMPIGSSMPEGWTKVNLAKGWTLVQGDQETETTGMSKKHSHYFGNNKETASVYKQGTVWFYNASGGTKDYVIATKARIMLLFFHKLVNRTDLAENNLAARLYAELWQYRK